MRRIAIIFITVLISICELFAQDFRREWIDGKLTWEDFTERTGGQQISELKYFLGYNTGRQRHGDTVVVRNIAHGYMDRNLSWINPEHKTEQYLRYNQVIFDIVEVHRRRLQFELDRIGTIFEVDGKFQVIYYSCTREIDRFSREANSGNDLNSIIFWEQKMSDELNRHINKPVPEFENRNFGYGFHAGFGSGFSTGSIGKHFSPTFNFIFGFDLAYKKSIFYLSGTLAGGKVRNDYLSEQNWYNKQSVNLAIIDVSYGYTFLDSRKLKLVPFAGFGITEFSRQDRENKEKRLSIVDYNIIFGVNADYKLRTKIKLVPNPFFGVHEKVETSIRARLYITRANFASDLNGYTINLTVGLCGFGNMIRLK